MGSGVSIGSLVGRSVDEDGLVCKKTIQQTITELDVLDEGVILSSRCLSIDSVVDVQSKGLLVGAVGLELLDRVDEVLVEEELTNVVGLAVKNVSVIGQNGRILSAHYVDMRGSAHVMTREDSVELDYTILVGGLDTTAVGGVEAGLAHDGDTTVSTSGVSMPDINQHVRNRFACVEIDELQVKVKRHTRLVVGNISLSREVSICSIETEI